MAKFLVSASYTAEGAKGLMKEGGSSRAATVEKMIAGLGGKMDCFYYAFGSADVYVIADIPDAVSALALSLAVNSTGAVTLSTTPLLTTQDMDAAAKKSVSYRAPGA